MRGKTVALVRADLNVPLEHGRVSDLSRLERLLPSLKELKEKGAKIVLLSHFRAIRTASPMLEFSLQPVAAALGDLLTQDNRSYLPKTASAPKPPMPSKP